MLGKDVLIGSFAVQLFYLGYSHVLFISAYYYFVFLFCFFFIFWWGSLLFAQIPSSAELCSVFLFISGVQKVSLVSITIICVVSLPQVSVFLETVMELFVQQLVPPKVCMGNLLGGSGKKKVACLYFPLSMYHRRLYDPSDFEVSHSLN